MPDKRLDEELMVLATCGLGELEVSFPDDSTAVLTCRFTPGSMGSSRRDTFVWQRIDEAWQCVMHSQTPPLTRH